MAASTGEIPHGVEALDEAALAGHRATDREATVRAKREGHGSLAGWRILKGLRSKVQEVGKRWHFGGATLLRHLFHCAFVVAFTEMLD